MQKCGETLHRSLRYLPAMAMPTDIGIIDLMLGIPDPGNKAGWYDFLKPNLRDEESKGMAFPAQYMFKDVPEDPPKALEMVAILVEGHEAVARTARGIFPLVEKAGDEPTADLLTQRLAIHEQTAWMLRSLLE